MKRAGNRRPGAAGGLGDSLVAWEAEPRLGVVEAPQRLSTATALAVSLPYALPFSVLRLRQRAQCMILTLALRSSARGRPRPNIFSRRGGPHRRARTSFSGPRGMFGPPAEGRASTDWGFYGGDLKPSLTCHDAMTMARHRATTNGSGDKLAGGRAV